MTNGIGRIFGGGNSYGVNGFNTPQNKETQEEANTQQSVVQQQTEDIDPTKIMQFLEANNIFVTPNTAATTPAELAPEVQDRVVNYMERFEELYGIVENEFGKDMAPNVMDLVMDKLMGLV